MSQALQTDVSILSLSHGRRSPHSIATRVVEPASGIAPAQGKGNLYLLLELDGPEQGRSRLYRELLNTIQETYYYHRENVATALTDALRAAHSIIRQYNQYHNVHFSAGATCLVATGSEIVSAQVGPAILAVRSRAGLQWFSPLNNQQYQPLGASTMPPVEIGRVAGSPDIVIVAMNSAWANYLEVPLMLEATTVPTAQAVNDQLAGIGIEAREELILLTVTLVEADPRAVAAAERMPPPVRERAASVADVRPAEPEVWDRIAEPEREEPGSPGEGRGLDLGGALGALGGAASAAGRGLSDFAREAMPERKSSARRPARKRPPRRIPYVLAIVAVLLVAIVAITAGMWYVQGRQRLQLFQDFMNGVAVNYEAARTSTDENQARVYLQAAREQLVEAERFSPENPDIEVWRNRIAELEAVINHVQPILAGFDAPLITFPAGSQPRRVFVNGLSVFVLDEGQDRLTRYQLDEATGDRLAAENAEQVLVSTGDTVGGRRVGELGDAVWAPAAGNRTATGPLVIDRSNQLFSTAEGLGPVNVTLAENPSLGFVAGMYYYAGNIYLLDTVSSQLWRYRPSGDSYGFDPEPYFSEETSVNLSPVIDVAIDGSVWLLHPNGTVFKFFQSVQEAFALDVVDPPMGDAVAIWANEVDMPDGKLFIADAASNRILVFDKTGTLLSQLMPADHPGVLNDLRSIFVDEAANYLYVLTGTTLYQAPLPPLDS